MERRCDLTRSPRQAVNGAAFERGKSRFLLILYRHTCVMHLAQDCNARLILGYSLSAGACLHHLSAVLCAMLHRMAAQFKCQ